jgi:hypothetical protein
MLLDQKHLFLPTGLARTESGTNIRLLSFLQGRANNKFVRSQIPTGPKRVLRVIWNVTE